jgi:hypothetical protein
MSNTEVVTVKLNTVDRGSIRKNCYGNGIELFQDKTLSFSAGTEGRLDALEPRLKLGTFRINISVIISWANSIMSAPRISMSHRPVLLENFHLHLPMSISPSKYSFMNAYFVFLQRKEPEDNQEHLQLSTAGPWNLFSWVPGFSDWG